MSSGIFFKGRYYEQKSGKETFRGRANSEAWNGTEWNSAEKSSFTKQQKIKFKNDMSIHQKLFFLHKVFWHFRLTRFVLSWFLFRKIVLNSIPQVCFYFVSMEFRVVFSSKEWFGMESDSLLLFCSTLRNSELFFPPEKGSERNYGSLLLFLFHGTEFRVVISSAEGFGTELWEFASIFVPQNGIPSCFLFCGKVRNGIPRVFCSGE